MLRDGIIQPDISEWNFLILVVANKLNVLGKRK
jgi:hypothetical protein